MNRVFRLLRPSHQHTAFSATLLLMTAVLLSRVIGYIREAYIAWAFGAGPATDAYVAGFTIPDWLNYLVAGGTASITFVSIYTRFLAENREEDAQKTFSVIITVMTAVLGIGIVLAEIFTPQISRHLFSGFTAGQLELCVHLTRILLPAQIFFYVGGVVSAVLLSRRLFLLPAFGPLLYNAAIILGGLLLSRRIGIASLAYGALAGSFLGPFLARLFGEKRMQEFAETVNGSIYRIIATSLLATALMMAAALPLIDLVYRRGHFSFSDSQHTALYFFWFSLSLAFWSAQALYSRAFYAAGNTLTPMIASSLITVASIPMYSALYRAFSTVGLAMASDVGIMANTLALAVLLHRRKLVRIDRLNWGEIGKAGITALIAGMLSYEVGRIVMANNSRSADLRALGLIALTWAAATAAGLWFTRSHLAQDLQRRKSTSYPRVAEQQAEDLSRGIEA